jgi:hypothetical protein
MKYFLTYLAHILFKELSEMLIISPDMEEQWKITDILDLTTLDQLIAITTVNTV